MLKENFIFFYLAINHLFQLSMEFLFIINLDKFFIVYFFLNCFIIKKRWLQIKSTLIGTLAETEIKLYYISKLYNIPKLKMYLCIIINADYIF